MSYVSPRSGLGTSTSSTIEASVGSTLASAVPLSGPAAPFVAIAAGISEMLAALGVGSGCGQTCVLSSNYANQAEALLQKNIAAYFAITPPRAASVQAAALANFDTIWADLEQQCSNSQLGSAGQKCISDRQEGGCTWKQPASSVPPWGTPPAGACWNWFNGYRNPIAQDPDVVPDADLVTATSSTSSSSSTAGASTSLPSSTWLLIAAAAAVVVWGLS